MPAESNVTFCILTPKTTHPLATGGVLIPDPNIKKEYDLVYSNQGGQWNDFARNWTLAKASIVTLVKELNFKVRRFPKNNIRTRAEAWWSRRRLRHISVQV